MRTVEWDEAQRGLVVIDQRRLPEALIRMTLTSPAQVAEAIRALAVRGAPAIGVAAAFGLVLAAQAALEGEEEAAWEEVRRAACLMRAARPTAVNLAWALERCLAQAQEADRQGLALRGRLLQAAQGLAEGDVAANRRIGQHGSALVRDGDTILHHCNTGALATVDYGTALGVIRAAWEEGKQVRVLVNETRPLLQGSRLTAWELQQLGIPHDILPDSAAAHFLQTGAVSLVLVGADRIAANGDLANKIGTYPMALAAHDNQVPFYVAAPTSTIDLALPDGQAIPIEWREASEVLDLQLHGRPTSPQGSTALNPAFDITPHRLITAFVTETGVLRPPFPASLSHAVEEACLP